MPGRSYWCRSCDCERAACGLLPGSSAGCRQIVEHMARQIHQMSIYHMLLGAIAIRQDSLHYDWLHFSGVRLCNCFCSNKWYACCELQFKPDVLQLIRSLLVPHVLAEANAISNYKWSLAYGCPAAYTMQGLALSMFTPLTMNC